MFTKLINKYKINFYLRCLFIPSLLLFLFSIFTTNLLAQEISKSKTILVGEEVIETITLIDANGLPINNEAELIVTIENQPENPDTVPTNSTNFVDLSVINIRNNEGIDGTVEPLLVNTDETGQRSFIIKGISEGKALITFSTGPNSENTEPNNRITVNVLAVDAKFNIIDESDNEITTDKQFIAPTTLKFIDNSTPEESETKTIKWFINNAEVVEDIDNGTLIENGGTIITKTFSQEGIFNVRLEITTQTDFGFIKDATSTSICIETNNTDILSNNNKLTIRPVTLLVGKEVFQTIRVINEADNDNASTGEIIVSIDDETKATLKLLGQEEEITNNDKIEFTNIENEQTFTFLITGQNATTEPIEVKFGTDTSNVSIIPESFGISVIDVEADFEISESGVGATTPLNENEVLFTAPTTLTFKDISSEKDNPISKREWTIISVDENGNRSEEEKPSVNLIEETFEKIGMFTITLKIFKQTALGEIHDEMSKTICINDTQAIDPGSIFGTVTDAINNGPLPGAIIVLTGVEEEEGKVVKITKFARSAGNYTFKDVEPGLYNVTACNGAKYECLLSEEVEVNFGDRIAINFALPRVGQGNPSQ